MTPQAKRAALYVRVSTTNRATKNPNVFEQDPSVQELPLRQMAEQRLVGGEDLLRPHERCQRIPSGADRT
jgi:hypothetical protein